MTVLSIEALRCGYANGPDVVHGIDLAAESGQVTVLLGPNGAGKTTVLRMLSGLLAPRGGSIRLDDREMTQASTVDRVRAGITLVPQGRQLFPDLTVRENLVMGAYAARHGVTERLEDVFELFGALKEKQSARCSTLSGGQQQMVAVGRGLMANPRVLLLDEACLGVAPVLRRALYTSARQIARERDVAVLATEQEVGLALEFSDRMAVLRLGRIVLGGASAQMSVDDERLKASYLGLELHLGA